MEINFLLNNKKYRLNAPSTSLRASTCYSIKITLPSNHTQKKEATVVKWDNSNKILFFKVDEKLYKAKVIKIDKNQIELYLFNFKKSFQIKLDTPNLFLPAKKIHSKQTEKIDTFLDLASPICGKVIKINVQANQIVKKNQTLVIIESMKMENEIKAKTDSFIKTILISQSDLVKQNQILMRLEKKGKKDGSTKNSYAKTSISNW